MLTFNEITILSIKITLNLVARRPKGDYVSASRAAQASEARLYKLKFEDSNNFLALSNYPTKSKKSNDIHLNPPPNPY